MAANGPCSSSMRLLGSVRHVLLHMALLEPVAPFKGVGAPITQVLLHCVRNFSGTVAPRAPRITKPITLGNVVPSGTATQRHFWQRVTETACLLDTEGTNTARLRRVAIRNLLSARRHKSVRVQERELQDIQNTPYRTSQLVVCQKEECPCSDARAPVQVLQFTTGRFLQDARLPNAAIADTWTVVTS